jgi:hypothetical protein
MWAIPVDSPLTRPAEIVKGPDQVLPFPAESKQVPMILSPDPGPFEHYRARLTELAQEALSPYGILPESGGSSGVALAQLESRAVNLWRTHAQACSVGEYRTLDLVARLLGDELSVDARAEWPTEFGALATTKQIADLQGLWDMTTDHLVREEIVMRGVDIMLQGLTEDRRQEIRLSVADTLEHEDAALLDDGGRPVDDELMPEPPNAAGGGKPRAMDPEAMG